MFDKEGYIKCIEGEPPLEKFLTTVLWVCYCACICISILFALSAVVGVFTLFLRVPALFYTILGILSFSAVVVYTTTRDLDK